MGFLLFWGPIGHVELMWNFRTFRKAQIGRLASARLVPKSRLAGGLRWDLGSFIVTEQLDHSTLPCVLGAASLGVAGEGRGRFLMTQRSGD
jgi:hypothetical protein